MLIKKKHFLWKKINLLRLIIIIGSVLLFAGGPSYYSPRSFKNIWDLGHILFFSILSYLILLSWPKNEKMTVFRQAFSVLFIVLFLGTLVEFAQAGSRRSPDILDVVRNVIGCLVTLSFFMPSKKTFPRFFLRPLQTITIVLVIAALFPAVKSITDEIVALRQFPVLSDFETPFEIDRWRGDSKFTIDHTFAFHGTSSLKVALNTSLYSGVSLKYFPRNWLYYKYLLLSIFNPDDEPIKVTCRINDMRHTLGIQHYDDRFNQSYSLVKGWNLITVPLEQVVNAPKNRKMELDKVQALGIFATGLSQPKVLYIDYVHLN